MSKPKSKLYRNTVAVRMTDEEFDQLDAARGQMTRSNYCREAVKCYIENPPKEVKTDADA